MSPAIGGEAAAIPGAIESLTQGGGAPAAGGPGAGAEQQRAQLAAFMGKLRELEDHVKQVYGEMPALQQFQQQHLAIIKQSVQKAAQAAAPTQTASSAAVPGASQ